MITERRIKDLSFALEALCRVNSYPAVEMRTNVEGLLAEEIEVAKKQQAEWEQVKDLFVKRDAAEMVKPEPNLENEIPF